ncbi:hypothetical protein GLAREA_10629 [Glarea lozoyensis ATCC 20868]|uniref:Zn(2)-C6 fungal-type domain-containing protein n=1 Tax=Glarea lozoyensis (strain ATCC 20868 / MF5171) TaxID=1116229 RepID=S3DCW8_GLAL2|nr:uncharacterized protein GLAREA_10629 [Glarea lozoyensis ATCC 20868]EPE34934.1 hypothetical protein GLAREA_10629 [Glarea lozoyensis ATCC 20868]
MPLRKGTYIKATHVRIIKFKVTPSEPGPAKRGKYKAERRREVNIVRQNRACLRCSLLKIKCNNNDVCKNCSDLILKSQDKKTLSFSGCIRTRLVEVSVFLEPYLAPPSIEEQATGKCNALCLAVISLKFSPGVKLELDAEIDDWQAWLRKAMESGDVRVATAPKCFERLAATTSEDEREQYKRMIVEEALVYEMSGASADSPEGFNQFKALRRKAGHGVLQSLDNRLRPQSLKDNSYAELQALFLTVLGIVFVISHMLPHIEDSRVVDQDFEGSEQDAYQLSSKSSHLYQVLAHYLVYLGSQLGIPLTTQMEQFIIQKRGFDKPQVQG